MEFPTRKWTMVVDLDRCTGCAACVVACHAENNVPIVTEREVVRRHAQHWIRIERYWEGNYPDTKAYFLPVMCQQCGSAPCEPVCPVFATMHSGRENLNLQVYNRCIGTRYCQNNDPWRVRFFNFFDPVFPEPLNNQLNPDVTVRVAGVMEKCTFCVQRIRRAEEDAFVQHLPIDKTDLQPACVQTCPPSALMFGDVNNPDDPITQYLRNNRRAFRLLEELGTEPAVVYLKGGDSYVNE